MIFFNPRGNIVKTFACGLGIGTNNQAERFALFFGLKMSSEASVRSLIVIRDSLLDLSQAKKRMDIQDQIVGRLHKRILSPFSLFDSLHFYHVHRDLTSLVDGLANQASRLPRGGYKHSEGHV